MFAVTQFAHGCRSVTSHFTRRALQVTHANFARFLGGSVMFAGEMFVSAVLSFGYEAVCTKLAGGLASLMPTQVHHILEPEGKDLIPIQHLGQSRTLLTLHYTNLSQLQGRIMGRLTLVSTQDDV